MCGEGIRPKCPKPYHEAGAPEHHDADQQSVSRQDERFHDSSIGPSPGAIDRVDVQNLVAFAQHARIKRPPLPPVLALEIRSHKLAAIRAANRLKFAPRERTMLVAPAGSLRV